MSSASAVVAPDVEAHEVNAGEPTTGAAVEGIAVRCGFAEPDRFAAYYRSVYRVVPSQMLRS